MFAHNGCVPEDFLEVSPCSASTAEEKREFLILWHLRVQKSRAFSAVFWP